MPGNYGRLYKNSRYIEGSDLPRYIGDCEIDGVKKSVAAWVRKSKNGKPYIYFSFEAYKGTVKEKIIPQKSVNREGVRKLDKIATGKKEEKIKTENIEVTGIPF